MGQRQYIIKSSECSLRECFCEVVNAIGHTRPPSSAWVRNDVGKMQSRVSYQPPGPDPELEDNPTAMECLLAPGLIIL